ncbi:MAG: hypothetical protein SPC28_04745 [Alloprevotella sp.]|nr:hypothetical protein [Alloprevotella sp.]
MIKTIKTLASFEALRATPPVLTPSMKTSRFRSSLIPTAAVGSRPLQTKQGKNH